MAKNFKFDVCVVGGAGHVGFPIGLIFASKKFKVCLLDSNEGQLEKILKNTIPFKEKNGKKFLRKYKKNIFLTSDPKFIRESKNIIICIGTPIKKNLKPELKNFFKFFRSIKKYLTTDQEIIVRSSVYIGSIEKIKKILNFNNIVYCPERIVQGLSLEELPKLPQIISGFNAKSIKNASYLFKKICKKIIITSVKEAELIKLYSNAYRYINFSISNQFYEMCASIGVSFSKVRKYMREGYERSASIPTAGFAAGPCLLKDTMQLHNFFSNKFTLGLSAMKINEGLPKFLLNQIEKEYDLKKIKIGILGLAFKAETDDIRDSLSIKMIKLLKTKKIKFLQSDEYYTDSKNVDAEKLIKESDVIVVGVMHNKYKKLKFPKNKKIINVW